MADKLGPEHEYWRSEQVEDLIGTARYKDYGISPYAEVVRVEIPEDLWSAVYYSWLGLKGHLQALHGYQRSDLFATAEEKAVLATFIVIWDSEEELAAWLEDGYTTEEMLRSVGVDEDAIHVTLRRYLA